MAPTVAVAGATGGVGKTLVEQIQHENKFPVIALTRQEHVESPVAGVQYVQVDYDDVDALARHLEAHQVQTVICAIGMLGDDCSEAQLNLINAAKQAASVQRFMPSEWGYYTVTREERKYIDPGIDWFLTAANALKESDLKFTRPVCGAFMDFLGLPHARSNIPPWNIAVDVLNREACIPGDGSTPLTMIYSYDAGTFVAKLLELDEWPEFSFCAGEDTSLGEALRLAEEVCGQKFKVTYMKPEDIANGDIPPMRIAEGSGIQPEDAQTYNVFGYQLYLAEAFHLPHEGRVGNSFPDVKTKTVKEFLTETWSAHV
ncbi:hypothetical protein N7532_000967 [Penicillium argentinense]|uniref:NmrA-like domain-containing protein n=1 Tax=Penicillium argentinense TaxID=1131581 RepID=A0A9W9KM21_9EURO|nr:uncharacterized protein N7532_000967 [Penicillium argentinense]KAJ5110432.1 hypothetical protein N7532_000967 [Penicillium argentinense]